MPICVVFLSILSSHSPHGLSLAYAAGWDISNCRLPKKDRLERSHLISPSCTHYLQLGPVSRYQLREVRGQEFVAGVAKGFHLLHESVRVVLVGLPLVRYRCGHVI